MIMAKSKLIVQGQLSVDGSAVVRRAGRYASAEVHRTLFPQEAPKDVPDVKESIQKYIRKKHAGR
jgi:hypothetical protein